MNIVQYFIAFISFSFIGWVYETALYTLQEKRFISSGFLKGPCCPIYGGGAVMMMFCFYGRTDNPFIIFFGGMALAVTLEYLTAVLLENIFHKKWWDYSNLKFNFQGRICLLGAVAFGVMCLLLCKIIQPVFTALLEMIPYPVQLWVSAVMAVAFCADCAVTIIQLIRKKDRGKECKNQLPDLNIQALLEYIIPKRKHKINK